MGINIPTRDELIANKMAADGLATYLGKNYLVYDRLYTVPVN